MIYNGPLEAQNAALQIAAKAVEDSADVWKGFSALDAKTCIDAYHNAKVIYISDATHDIGSFDISSTLRTITNLCEESGEPCDGPRFRELIKRARIFLDAEGRWK